MLETGGITTDEFGAPFAATLAKFMPFCESFSRPHIDCCATLVKVSLNREYSSAVDTGVAAGETDIDCDVVVEGIGGGGDGEDGAPVHLIEEVVTAGGVLADVGLEGLLFAGVDIELTPLDSAEDVSVAVLLLITDELSVAVIDCCCCCC